MNREVSFQKVNDYFRDLVSKTDYIKKFFSISPEELVNDLNSGQESEFPILVLFGYEAKLNGNQQRTFGTRTITFSILFNCKPDDYRGQEKAINDAEVYGLNFLSRINLDSKVHTYPWLANVFDKDSVVFDVVQYENAKTLFGIEFSFDLSIKDPLSAKEAFWNDVTDFCNYP